MLSIRALSGAMLATLTSGAALAADYGFGFGEPMLAPYEYTTPDESVRLRAGIGAMYLEANELVFAGDYTVSHLIWQSRSPVLRGAISVDVGHGFSISAEASVAGFASSYMEDYDWLAGDDTFANWTHRSQHPDTDLDHYWTGAAAVGMELARLEDAVVRLHTGFKYTDVKWSSYGGSYVYSSGPGFRDLVGNFADGEPAIAYRQQFPEVFLGLDGDQYYGDVRVGGLLRGGLTLFSVATDDHWMRDLRFIDNLWAAPTLTVGADIGFPLGEAAEFVLAARYDHIFQQRGETRIYDTNTGTLLSVNSDSAGGALRSAEITAGLAGSF